MCLNLPAFTPTCPILKVAYVFVLNQCVHIFLRATTGDLSYLHVEIKQLFR